MSDILSTELNENVKDLSNIMHARQTQSIMDGIRDITKTVDDIKYLKEQKGLYIDLRSDLLDFESDDDEYEEKENKKFKEEDGKVIGELVISGKTIFKNIGLEYFVLIDRSECITFLEERLEAIEETNFVLDNKLNNLIRNLKISYPALSKDIQKQVDTCIKENELGKKFNTYLLIERDIQTGNFMPNGAITDDLVNNEENEEEEEPYVFNDSYGTGEDDIMEIIEQLDESGNIISSNVSTTINGDKVDEPKRGKNYKKNKKKRARAKAKKQEKRLKEEMELQKSETGDKSHMKDDQFYEMLEDMGIINQQSKNNVTENREPDVLEEEIPKDLPIIKEVDIKDIQILGPRVNSENGQVEVPDYLKYNDPTKPAIDPKDIMEYTDLIKALENMEMNEEEGGGEEEDIVVNDIVETELLPAEIEYDYEKLNKYFVEDNDYFFDNDKEVDLSNLKFDEEDLFDEEEFDIKALMAQGKKESLKDKIEEILIESKQHMLKYQTDIEKIETKSILKVTNDKSEDNVKKSVSFASSLQIKEFENIKMFNKRNTFVNMSYYMNLDGPIEIELDTVTQRNTDLNKISIIIDNDTVEEEEEEAQTETLDTSEINKIMEETANKLTGGDDLTNDINNNYSEEDNSSNKEKVSRFRKDRQSRKSKRNSLMFSEMTDFAIKDIIVENNDNYDEPAIEPTIIEHDFVDSQMDQNEDEDEEEGDESFNTIYQKSLQNGNNFFTDGELEEGREYAENIFLEQESEFLENEIGEDGIEEEFDLGPVEDEEFEINFEAKKKIKEQTDAEERALNEMVHSEYEFPEELIKAINEDKDIEIIQEPKIDYSQFRTTDEMAQAYITGLYDDERDEFSAKNYKRVDGMHIDYTDDSHKGYIIEKLQDFEGYNEQVEVLKDDIAEFIKETTQTQLVEATEEEDNDNGIMVDIVENEFEFDNSLIDIVNGDKIEENDDAVNYFDFNDEEDYRLNENVLKEDISKEYQRLKQKIIKKQKLEEAASDIVEHESKQFEPIDESGNVVKKSRFKQQRIKMNL